MKKYLYALITVIFISCDDGDVELQSFDFSNQPIEKCSDNNLLFKTKGDETLLIGLSNDTFNSAFENTETGDTPRLIPISSPNFVLYRKYSENITSATLCSTLAPATPFVIKEWATGGGVIKIETNAIYDTDGITILRYTHNIVLENVSFINNEESFTLSSYIFGDYETSL